MNPTRTTKPQPTMYGFPLPAWTIPADARTPFLNRLYEDAYAVLTEPASETAAAWAEALEEDGFRAITAPLPLTQIVSLVSELPPRAIVRLIGRRPTDEARQEAVRALYAPAED